MWLHKKFVFLFILIVSAFVQAGLKTDSNYRKSGETKVQIWIDSMPPGPIGVKQLLSAKIVRITSPEGLNYKIKSFTLLLLPHKGRSTRIINFLGNRFKGLESSLSKVSEGDHITLGNFVIENLPNYMPETQPMWIIVADSK